MSTQGLLSVVNDGQVKMKVIVFSDGDRINLIKDWIKENIEANRDTIWLKLTELFSLDSLVLQTGPEELLESLGTDWTPNYLYKDKYNEPCYYPCVSFDTADYTVVLDCIDGQLVERDLESFWQQKYSKENRDTASQGTLIDLPQLGEAKFNQFPPEFKGYMMRLLSDILEMEESAKEWGNDQFVSGSQYARINLETLIERYGMSRIKTIQSKSTVIESNSLNLVQVV